MTVIEVGDVARPTSPDTGTARDASLAVRRPLHGAWAGLAVAATVLLAWIDAGFHSGRGLVVDWLTAVALGWVAIGSSRRQRPHGADQAQ